MTITTKQGKRHPDDIVIFYNGKAITPYELVQMLILFWNNEDKIRPSTDKGSKMLMELINEVFETREIADDMIKRYYLTKPLE